MAKALPGKISIFLSLDPDIFKGYFNAQDPAPIYKRQLSHEFEQYIMACSQSAKRYNEFVYKISWRNEEDKEFAEPLVYAIRRHFSEKKEIRQAEFEKFKRRTYSLLLVSITVVMVCHHFLPLLFNGNKIIHTGLSNSMDVFTWVILWKPIDRLIFYWNPFLKEISLLDRLQKAEVITNKVED